MKFLLNAKNLNLCGNENFLIKNNKLIVEGKNIKYEFTMEETENTFIYDGEIVKLFT